MAGCGATMSEPELVMTDAPSDEAAAVIAAGLASHNLQQNGYRDWRPVAALLRDADTGATLGGMIGKTSYGLLFIDRVFLPAEKRGQDIGSRLLAMMEREAVARGCMAGFLYTGTYQAPGFYERNGWTEFGRIACDPPGSARVFMTKNFQPAKPPEPAA